MIVPFVKLEYHQNICVQHAADYEHPPPLPSRAAALLPYSLPYSYKFDANELSGILISEKYARSNIQHPQIQT